MFRAACARRDVKWKGDIPQQNLHNVAGIVVGTQAGAVLPTASVTVSSTSTFTTAPSKASAYTSVVPDCSFLFTYGNNFAMMSMHPAFRTVVELRKSIGHAWRQKISTSLPILQNHTVLKTQEIE